MTQIVNTQFNQGSNFKFFNKFLVHYANLNLITTTWHE